jgi:hypothetical protein
MATASNPTVTVNYNPNTGAWTYGGSINANNGIAVPQGSNTVTFNLTSPSGAVFSSSSPLTWPGGQPSCVSGVSGAGTTTVSFTDNNTNSTTTPVDYSVLLTITLSDGKSATSPDPTLINEGTGGV